MQTKLFKTNFANHELILDDKTILYSQISGLHHFNHRHKRNFVPAEERFCIKIEHDSSPSTLLYCKINLVRYAGADGLISGFKIPQDVEEKIINLRSEYLATLKTLSDKSGVTPQERGLLFDGAMTFLALFKNTHVAAA